MANNMFLHVTSYILGFIEDSFKTKRPCEPNNEKRLSVLIEFRRIHESTQ